MIGTPVIKELKPNLFLSTNSKSYRKWYQTIERLVNYLPQFMLTLANDRDGWKLIGHLWSHSITTTSMHNNQDKSNVVFVSLIYDELFTFKGCWYFVVVIHIWQQKCFHHEPIIKRYTTLLVDNFLNKFLWCPFTQGNTWLVRCYSTQGWTATTKQDDKKEKVV